MQTFKEELRHLLNKHSVDAKCNTPDNQLAHKVISFLHEHRVDKSKPLFPAFPEGGINGAEEIPKGRFGHMSEAVEAIFKSPRRTFMDLVDRAEQMDYDKSLAISSEIAKASEVILKHAAPEQQCSLSQVLILNYRTVTRRLHKTIS